MTRSAIKCEQLGTKWSPEERVGWSGLRRRGYKPIKESLQEGNGELELSRGKGGVLLEKERTAGPLAASRPGLGREH